MPAHLLLQHWRALGLSYYETKKLVLLLWRGEAAVRCRCCPVRVDTLSAQGSAQRSVTRRASAPVDPAAAPVDDLYRCSPTSQNKQLHKWQTLNP